ncbi:hypothetical protein [Micromonospora sp. SL4-19]|uniref:hypothetical protein n=1 Tax=Micromonospora sp. SL4-19 TaxID=3399129 RepID=UPI003A4E3DD2
MLLRLAYLGVAHVFALLRLLPRIDHDKDVEILILRHQIAVLQRQLGDRRVRFQPADRALLPALLRPLPRAVLRQLRLLVHPGTILRWQSDLLARRHAIVSRPRRPGRLRALCSIRALALRLARENSNWGYRRVHGELLALGIKVAASTVWKYCARPALIPHRTGQRRPGPHSSARKPKERTARPGAPDDISASRAFRPELAAVTSGAPLTPSYAEIHPRAAAVDVSRECQPQIGRRRHDGWMAAVDAWFLGGPVDGRLMPVEVTADGGPPAVVELPQTGYYIGASDIAGPTVEHVYVLVERLDGTDVYQYQQPPFAGSD